MSDSNEAPADPLIPKPLAQPPQPLAADNLRWRCDPAKLSFKTTADLEPIVGVVGQDDAVEALRFGLEIDAPGQNIFVRGLTGTGRMTLVRRLLEEVQLSCPAACDRCYVHNFADPQRPRLISLPRGQGHVFRKHVDELAEFITNELEAALSSEPIRARQIALERKTQDDLKKPIEPFEEALGEAGLGLVSVQRGPVAHAALYPLVDGKPVTPEEWEQLRASKKVTDRDVEKFQKQRDAFDGQLRTVMKQVNEIRRRHVEAFRTLRREASGDILGEFVRSIEAEFPQPEVRAFLHELVEDAADALVDKPPVAPEQQGNGGPDNAARARLYRVNVVLSHAGDDSCPVVIENAPTVDNLLGTIERRVERGQPDPSDHLRIRAGSLLRADGGYLIVEARDVLREPGAWPVLLRTLRTGCLEIVPPESRSAWWAPSIKPEPVEIKVKVILLGDADLYYALDELDPEFPHLFKVLADFGSEIPRDDEGVMRYARVLARIVTDENLAPLHASAVAALAEHGARIAGRQDRLTARFGRLADIAREASFVATKAGKKLVKGDDVRTAIKRTKRRADLPSRRFRELLADGTIRITTTGSVIGQINGLAVMQAGPLTFGFPARITATIGPGTAGVINIEGEASLSGSIHTKGFYILGGLLRYLLPTQHSLTFNASIALEQTYGGIDGDSASGAEICCLLSALTEIPLRQDLAMTGAIDQVGNIMAIGGANEKIEGFYDTCHDIGLSGTQGVIIPQANARDLMLREDVVEACRAGQFHVYTADKIVDALELLTGVEAGNPDHEDLYPPDTLLGLAILRSFEYWLRTQQNAEIVQEEEADAPSEEAEPDEQRSD